MRHAHRSLTLFVIALACLLFTARPLPAADSPSPAPAERKVLTRLGGANAFVRPGLKTREDVQKMFVKKRADIEKALSLAGWDGKPQDLFDAVAAGKFEEAKVPPGTEIIWMAMRDRKQAALCQQAVWGGKEAFNAFHLSLVSNDVRSEFYIPLACGNLALLERTPIPAPVARISVSKAKECVSRDVVIDASTSSVSYGSLSNVSVTVKGPDGKTEDLGKPASGWKWTRSWKAPGTYTFTAVATSDSGRRSEPATATLELTPCPPTCSLLVSVNEAWADEDFDLDASASRAQVGTLRAVHVEVSDAAGARVADLDLTPPFKTAYHLKKGGRYTFKAVAEDDLGQKSGNACEASIAIVPKSTVAMDFFGGKERRVRPEFAGGRCAPLLGMDIGLSWMPNRRWELFFGPGFAYNTREDENSSLFAKVELNRHWRTMFAGIGLAAWDITHSREPGFAPVGLIQFGTPLVRRLGRKPIQLFIQGGVPLDELDDIDNNYMFWVGLRFHLN